MFSHQDAAPSSLGGDRANFDPQPISDPPMDLVFAHLAGQCRTRGSPANEWGNQCGWMLGMFGAIRTKQGGYRLTSQVCYSWIKVLLIRQWRPAVAGATG